MIVVMLMLMMLMLFAVHCTWVTSNAYSSPSIVLATTNYDGYVSASYNSEKNSLMECVFVNSALKILLLRRFWPLGTESCLIRINNVLSQKMAVDSRFLQWFKGISCQTLRACIETTNVVPRSNIIVLVFFYIFLYFDLTSCRGLSNCSSTESKH